VNIRFEEARTFLAGRLRKFAFPESRHSRSTKNNTRRPQSALAVLSAAHGLKAVAAGKTITTMSANKRGRQFMAAPGIKHSARLSLHLLCKALDSIGAEIDFPLNLKFEHACHLNQPGAIAK
jgi:hypothetical protein